jgi:hAT family C-terminal dimerisation region
LSESDVSEAEITSTDSSLGDDESMDELDQYLSTERLKNVTNPLRWWFDNRGTYPRLWRMARDYLTIPGKCYCISITPQLG